eukprot:GFYU01004877.1.p1 GENE.GFYU01004877.1~~GFYU01004877.1.p1  ORF type:complete len:196 (+),score=11.64 GFYU01004877.1:241-828(+)
MPRENRMEPRRGGGGSSFSSHGGMGSMGGMSMNDLASMSFDQMRNNMDGVHSGQSMSMNGMPRYPPAMLGDGNSMGSRSRALPAPSMSNSRRGRHTESLPARPGTAQSEMDYEYLLSLDDDVKRRGVSSSVMRRLPVAPPQSSESRQTCHVCKDKIGTLGLIMKLPCGHFYHEDCVKQWFNENRTCPVCRTEVEK